MTTKSIRWCPSRRRAVALMASIIPWLILSHNNPASAQSESDPLALYQWERRVILLFADTENHSALRDQRDVLATDPQGLAERHLEIIEIIGEEEVNLLGGPRTAAALRAVFRVEKDGFTALLIGKDGGVKLRSASPFSLETLLYPTIDAMPMRKAEMKKAEMKKAEMRRAKQGEE